MILLVPPRREPDPPLPAEARPPEVVVDSSGAEVRFFGVPQWRIKWAQIREVAVHVIDYGGGHAEGFWELTGEGVELAAPVKMVPGSDAFNARLFALPRFDRHSYRRAREAEARAEPGWFVCWRGACD